MAIPKLYSAKRIEQQFHTGEEPVMVMCSDVNLYVCKYMRSSATFDYSLSQLTSTDTILWSDLFRHLVLGTDRQTALTIANRLKSDFDESLRQSSYATTDIVEEIPQEWKVPTEIVCEKLRQLFDGQWIAAVWENFMECLNENIG